jgi:hypothetical protein
MADDGLAQRGVNARMERRGAGAEQKPGGRVDDACRRSHKLLVYAGQLMLETQPPVIVPGIDPLQHCGIARPEAKCAAAAAERAC